MNILRYIYKTIILLVLLMPANVDSSTETSDIVVPRTRAEISNYRQTSTLQDVIHFFTRLQAQHHSIAIQTIGHSSRGRRIPMVICSRPLITSPVLARRLDRPIVFIQANIHAGEVEGKEAVQMIVRDRLLEVPGGLLDKIILLVVPVLNTDGNEAFDAQSTNRPNQNGPEMVGERANGQGLDINRDYIKTETSEVTATLKYVFNRWDPDVFIDLHATNGTLHGYQLTYAPPLHPNTEDSILRFTRDQLLPKVREILNIQYDLETFDYGNLSRQQKEPAWYTFSPDPRYATNYVGLRNRISILSEAMSYLSFQDRVSATYRFVNTILDEIARQGSDVISLTRQADLRVMHWSNEPQTAPAMGVRFDFENRGQENILLEKSATPGRRPRGSSPLPPKDIIEVKMPVFDRFKPTRMSRYPAAYLFSSELTEIFKLLQRHGIEVRQLRADWRGQTEAFVIEEIVQADIVNQGHRTNRLEGHFEPIQSDMSSGDFMVSTAQPLGILIFQLLEPESMDGLAAWNFIDEKIQLKKHYPILKLLEPINCPTEIVSE